MWPSFPRSFRRFLVRRRKDTTCTREGVSGAKAERAWRSGRIGRDAAMRAPCAGKPGSWQKTTLIDHHCSPSKEAIGKPPWRCNPEQGFCREPMENAAGSPSRGNQSDQPTAKPATKPDFPRSGHLQSAQRPGFREGSRPFPSRTKTPSGRQGAQPSVFRDGSRFTCARRARFARIPYASGPDDRALRREESPGSTGQDAS